MYAPSTPHNLALHTSKPLIQTYYSGGLPAAIPDFDIEAHETFYEIVLFQSVFDHPERPHDLAAEAWNSGVLDSGATKTVCG